MFFQVALLSKFSLSIITFEGPYSQMHSCMVDKVPRFVECTRAMGIFTVNHSLLTLRSVARGEGDRTFVFLKDIILLVRHSVLKGNIGVRRINRGATQGTLRQI